jgi:hypothetical protein
MLIYFKDMLLLLLLQEIFFIVSMSTEAVMEKLPLGVASAAI